MPRVCLGLVHLDSAVLATADRCFRFGRVLGLHHYFALVAGVVGAVVWVDPRLSEREGVHLVMGQVSTGECSVHRDHIVNDRILIDPDHSVVDSNHDRHVPGLELSVGISPPVRYVDIGRVGRRDSHRSRGRAD